MKLSERLQEAYKAGRWNSTSELAEDVSRALGRPVSRQTIENVFGRNRDYVELIDALFEVLLKEEARS